MELQLQTEYDVLRQPETEYDYVESTNTRSYPGMRSHGNVKNQPVLYSSINKAADAYEDAPKSTEYEVPVTCSSLQTTMMESPSEEYSHLKR